MSVFDHIIAGRIPASFVHRDEHCVAFMDIRPMSRGHVLVVPMQSVATLDELDPAMRTHLLDIALRVATATRAALGSAAQHFLVNDGKAASQTVPHVHIHVVPRYRGDRWATLLRMTSHIVMIALPVREHARMRQRLHQEAVAIAAAMLR